MKFLIANLVFISLSLSQVGDSLFQLGNYYYENQQYKKAVICFEQLEENFTHEYLYLNLGNSYYRTGELGNAVWAYEKAYSISPRDQDIIYNLNFVRSQLKDKIIQPDFFLIFSLYKSVLNKITILDIIIFSGLLFFSISIFYLVNAYLFVYKMIKTIFNYTIIIALACLILISFDKYFSISEINEGIIITPSVNVRSAPIERGENIIFRIHEGTKTKISISEPDWYEIILLDGKKGWIKNKNMRKL